MESHVYKIGIFGVFLIFITAKFADNKRENAPRGQHYLVLK